MTSGTELIQEGLHAVTRYQPQARALDPKKRRNRVAVAATEAAGTSPSGAL